MIVVISGSEYSEDYYVLDYILAQIPITHIIVGNAKGIDWVTEIYARSNNIPFTIFETDRTQPGNRSTRNDAILTTSPKPDLLLVFPGYQSVTMCDTIRQAKELNIPSFITNVTDCYTQVDNIDVLVDK